MEAGMRPDPIRYYDEAKHWFLRSRFYQEVLWQAIASNQPLTERVLLREHAWVVLNSGFREATVRRHFNYISLCFCDWESSATIVAAGEVCVASALAVFNNVRKLTAILRMAKLLNEVGFAAIDRKLQSNTISTLRCLPYVGPVTALHLAKNLGYNVVKPDRHLVRLALWLGCTDPAELCQTIATATGDEESVVDLILWRFQQQIAESKHQEPVISPTR